MSAPGGLRPIRIAIPAILLLAIAGCSAASGSPTASQPPSSAPTASPTSESVAPEDSPSAASTEAPPSAAPSAASGTLCTSGGASATGPELTIEDPDVGANLPVGWEPMDIDEYHQLLVQAAAAMNDPRVTEATEWQAGLIAERVMRAAAWGRSEPSGARASIILSVLPVPENLQTTVDFRLNDQATHGIPIKVLELAETDLPIGPAYCAGFVSDIEIGTPSQSIEYIALEPGGQAISIGGTAPVGDVDFPDVVRSVALSLAAN